MRRVLIVSPHWAPINAPDMQRVRLSLPYFRRHGWEPVVLALSPDTIEGGVRDPLLEQSYPSDIEVVRVKGISPKLTRWAGIGNLWWRSAFAYSRRGDQLLKKKTFDLSFLSTTQFGAFNLGPRWKKRFGVPYVLDYQDPWRNDYYRNTNTRPPGGYLKFFISQLSAMRQEPEILRSASGVISVSNTYGAMLQRFYPFFDPKDVRVLPFGASEADFEIARRHQPAKPLVNFKDGLIHHVYTGRCGPDMRFAMSVVFRAFRHYLDTHPEKAKRHRFHFIGTDYAPPPLGREWAMPSAREAGIGDHVEEHCYRVSYFDALHYLTHADSLIAVGSNDPTYAASKVFPYILARRPMLLVFHQESLVVGFTRLAGAGTCLSFNGPEDIEPLAAVVHRRWFIEEGFRRYEPHKVEVFRPYTAEHLTGELCACFDRAAQGASRS